MKFSSFLRPLLLLGATSLLLTSCEKDPSTSPTPAASAGASVTSLARSAYSLPTDPQPHYYVSASSGNDANAGTSTGAPLRSVEAALSKLNGGGGTIYCTGTFWPSSNIVVHRYNDGTAGNWLLLRDWPGQSRPIIDGGGASEANNKSIYFGDAEYTVFQGFEVRNATNGVVGNNLQHVRFLNNEVHHIYRQGIAAWGNKSGQATYDSDDVIIDANVVHDAVLDNQGRDPKRLGWESGIIFSKGKNAVLSNNVTYRNYGEGVIAANADNVQVRHNTSYDNFSNYLYLDNSSNCVFEQNLAYNTGNTKYWYVVDGSYLQVPLTALAISDESVDGLGVHVNNNVVRNNVFVNGGTNIIVSLKRGGSVSYNNRILNNTCYQSYPGKGLLEFEGVGSHQNMEVRNNIFRQTNNGRYVQLNGYSGAGITWGHNNWFGGEEATKGVAATSTDVNQDPQLINPNGGLHDANNFKPGSASPVINRGFSHGSVVPTDFLGTARPAGGSFDIGAHEQAGSGGTSPTPSNPGADFAGYYQLISRHSGKALDVKYSSTDDRADVWQHTPSSSAAQRWFLEKLPDGYYRLTAQCSKKALDVDFSIWQAGFENGANVQQFSVNVGDNQRWRIEATSDGFYRLINKASGKCLDVDTNNPSGGRADGDNVHQWTYGGGANQQWQLRYLGPQ